MAFEGQTRTCGQSGFQPGVPYPTVQLEKIQDRLVDISMRASQILDSRFSGLATLFVPVSVALMNRYDDEYLGIKKDEFEHLDAPEGAAGEAPAGKPTGPADPATYQPGKRLEFPSDDCQSCSQDDCGGCASASSGGCKGKPYIIEVGGPKE